MFPHGAISNARAPLDWSGKRQSRVQSPPIQPSQVAAIHPVKSPIPPEWVVGDAVLALPPSGDITLYMVWVVANGVLVRATEKQ